MTRALAAFIPDWTRDEWIRFGIRCLILITIGLLISVLGRRYTRRLRRHAKAADDLDGRKARRRATVASLIVTTVAVIVWFTVVITIMEGFGISVGPLLASAGIAGVALGFGAQSLVRDTISGLFILLEGQFDVGDAIDLDTEGGRVSGTIEGLTLRVTSVRQFDGTLSVIPNGLIQITSNKTRGWARAIVDVRVAIDEDPEKVRDALIGLFEVIVEQEPFQTGLRKEPQILGVTQTTDTAQVIRVVAETQPNQRFEVERALRERVSALITEKGIRVPPVSATPQREQGL